MAGRPPWKPSGRPASALQADTDVEDIIAAFIEDDLPAQKTIVAAG